MPITDRLIVNANCKSVCVCVSVYARIRVRNVCMYVCMYVCVYNFYVLEYKQTLQHSNVHLSVTFISRFLLQTYKCYVKKSF